MIGIPGKGTKHVLTLKGNFDTWDWHSVWGRSYSVIDWFDLLCNRLILGWGRSYSVIDWFDLLCNRLILGWGRSYSVIDWFDLLCNRLIRFYSVTDTGLVFDTRLKPRLFEIDPRFSWAEILSRLIRDFLEPRFYWSEIFLSRDFYRDWDFLESRLIRDFCFHWVESWTGSSRIELSRLVSFVYFDRV